MCNNGCLEAYAPVAVAATVELEASRALALYHCVLRAACCVEINQ